MLHYGYDKRTNETIRRSSSGLRFKGSSPLVSLLSLCNQTCTKNTPCSTETKSQKKMYCDVMKSEKCAKTSVSIIKEEGCCKTEGPYLLAANLWIRLGDNKIKCGDFFNYRSKSIHDISIKRMSNTVYQQLFQRRVICD